MEFVLIGLITAANLIFVKKKFELKRYEDGAFDLFLLIVITVIFGGSFGGLVVGMVASLAISMYLFASPPKFITPLFSKLRTTSLPKFGPIRPSNTK
jgi:hypothetical protein